MNRELTVGKPGLAFEQNRALGGKLGGGGISSFSPFPQSHSQAAATFAVWHGHSCHAVLVLGGRGTSGPARGFFALYWRLNQLPVWSSAGLWLQELTPHKVSQSLWKSQARICCKVAARAQWTRPPTLCWVPQPWKVVWSGRARAAAGGKKGVDWRTEEGRWNGEKQYSLGESNGRG